MAIVDGRHRRGREDVEIDVNPNAIGRQRCERSAHRSFDVASVQILAVDEVRGAIAERGNPGGRDLGGVARPELGERTRIEHGHQRFQILAKEADLPERDRDLAVGGLAGRRGSGRPSILVAVDHHQARPLAPIADADERAEHNGAVPADQQGQPLRVGEIDHARPAFLDQRQQGRLVEQPAPSTLTTGRFELQIATVANAGRSEPLRETRRPSGLRSRSRSLPALGRTYRARRSAPRPLRSLGGEATLGAVHGRRQAGRLEATAEHGALGELPLAGLLAPSPRERDVRGEHPLRPLLGQLAEARRLVDRVADHRVLKALLGADVAGHGDPRRDADPEADPAHLAVEAIGEPPRGAQRVAGRVVAGHRGAEDAQRSVALELVDEAALGLDGLDDDPEEAVEQRGRPRSAAERQGDRRRADEVDEHGADLALLAPEASAAAQRRAGDLAADLAAEQVADVLALAQALGHPVEARLQQADLAAVVDPPRRRRSRPPRPGRAPRVRK